MTEPHITIAVTGGTGFIGRHLIPRMEAEGVEVRILTRRPAASGELFPRVTCVGGDLRDAGAVRRFIEGADAVVHLAYSAEASDAELDQMTANLAAAARSFSLRSLVHISTAAVVGAVSDDVIDETTPCCPTTPYERRKLRMENCLADSLASCVPLVILRPTAVFGPGGKNLMKLTDDLVRNPALLSALRLSMLRRRRLNLVCVENVVEAIWFASTSAANLAGQRFIVADDDAMNDYESVSRFLAARLALPLHSVPLLPPLDGALRVLLRLRGRSRPNPRSTFSSRKLLAAGYRPAISLREGLERFSDWYHQKARPVFR